jgi:catechol 2,3-dioxygenase-like lactoylglutathione lyase family enzyme
MLRNLRSTRPMSRPDTVRRSRAAQPLIYDVHAMLALRYLVNDVAAAVDFYVGSLGFTEEARYGPAMAIVERDGMRLWLAGPSSSAARAMPDGRTPEPGGWNRIVVEVDDLDDAIQRLKKSSTTFRNEPITGPGGSQVLVEDPSGNPVELFQPR